MKIGVISLKDGTLGEPVPKSKNDAIKPPKDVDLDKKDHEVIRSLINRIPMWSRTTVEKSLMRKARKNAKPGEVVLTHAERFCIENFITRIPTKERAAAERRLLQKIIDSYGS